MIPFEVPQYPKPVFTAWRNHTWVDRNGVLRVHPPRTRLGRSGAGRNARGLCSHKRTKQAKPAKRQNPPQGGPGAVRANRIADPGKMPGTQADRKKNR